MSIGVICPHCKKSLPVAEELCGKSIRCGACETVFVAPPAALVKEQDPPRAEELQEKPGPKADDLSMVSDRRRLQDVGDDGARRFRGKQPEERKSGRFLWSLAIGGGAVLVAAAIAALSVWSSDRKSAAAAPAPVSGVRPAAQKALPMKFVVEAVGGQPPRWNDDWKTPPEATSDRQSIRPPLEIVAGPDRPNDPHARSPLGKAVPVQADDDTHLTEDVLKRVKRATAMLKVTRDNGGGSGSGFLLQGKHSLLLTNAHVVGMLDMRSPPPRQVEVIVNSGEPDETTFVGTVVAVDRDEDLAVLRVNPMAVPGLTVVPRGLTLASAKQLRETQPLFIFGFPFGKAIGKNITVSTTTVSSLRKNEQGELAQVQVNGGMHPGNSGGPVVDARGNVVGVSVSGIRATQINFAVPGDTALRMMEGRLDDFKLSYPSIREKAITLQADMRFVDPLGKIRASSVEWWIGDPGPARPAGQVAPEAAGDGPHQKMDLKTFQGLSHCDLVLEPLPAGKAYWFQPSYTTDDGTTHWSEAKVYNLGRPVEPKFVPLVFAFRPRKVAVELTSKATLRIDGDDRTIGVSLEAKMTEITKPALKDGTIPVRLEVGQAKAAQNVTTKQGRLSTSKGRTYTDIGPLGIDLQLSDGNDILTIKPDLSKIAADKKGEAAEVAERIDHWLHTAMMPLQPIMKTKPQSVWQEPRPLPAIWPGGSPPGFLAMVYHYRGVDVRNGRREALITLDGVVQDDFERGVIGGRAKGLAIFDLEAGYFTEIQLTINLKTAVLIDGEGYPARGEVELRVVRDVKAAP
jgi:S1-C subfamily serine protease